MLDMFLPGHATRVVVYTKPVPMNWGPDRLRRFCKEEMNVEPTRGTVALFFNRAQDTLKLYWVGTNGDEMLTRKLTTGAFLLPTGKPGQSYVVLKPAALPSLFRTK